MCTVVILRRPGHDWPLIFAANRDEMNDRPWLGPGRHWPDRPHVTAGLDELASGSWLGLNDDGVIAGVLNRPGSLGPDPDLRSRGELPLEALDHSEAEAAAEALSMIDPAGYRPFNLAVADARKAFWLCSRGDGEPIRAAPVPDGLSMITAFDMNDEASPRIRRFKPRFEASQPPDPEISGWAAWQALMGGTDEERADDPKSEPEEAMTFATGTGFATVSSSLMALPTPGWMKEGSLVKPVWLFAPGAPDKAPYGPIQL